MENLYRRYHIFMSWRQFTQAIFNFKISDMTVQEICDYFKNEIYQSHPEYEVEPIVIDKSHHFYMIVHLRNGKSYCFLVIPDFTDKPFDQIKPSKEQLSEFLQKDLFSNCVLQKVMIIKKKEDKIEHRHYPIEHFENE
jgi:hypothetical protein